ncbi:hypothetical protein VitviT2T_018177 [Vitis vinifera]|uniref:SAWADEE domain-containing protein n=2 Tax=Vitis vinifera TaxID=29760 RepID=A0ABY9CYN4_VITVI|nr:hypothetical protein VitviT2T_018177 [Vitis vinifera]
MPPQEPTSAASTQQFALEFRGEDDAWYAVRLVLRGETLTVEYEDFSSDYSDVFKAGEFTTLADVESFGRRFRRVSLQLQDSQCGKVIQCMTVCASHAFNDDDVRFYDAVVEEVENNEHSFEDGEEECFCNFILFWKDGPNAGNLTSARVENICLIQHSDLTDPTLASFMKKSREKIKTPSINSASEGGEKRTMETSSANQSLSVDGTYEGRLNNHPEVTEPDRGNTTDTYIEEFDRQQYQIIIENMEKDLGSLTIVQFIYEQIHLTPEVYIVPSFLTHFHPSGIVIVNGREELKKLSSFLSNPDHMIISPRGRPWVMAEEPRSIKEKPFMNWTPFPQGGNAVKVVHSGTEEYKRAKRLWDLYMDYRKQVALEHRNYERLVQRVAATDSGSCVRQL